MRMGTQEVSAYKCAPQQKNNTDCTKVILKDQRNYCTKSTKKKHYGHIRGRVFLSIALSRENCWTTGVCNVCAYPSV